MARYMVAVYILYIPVVPVLAHAHGLGPMLMWVMGRKCPFIK